MVKVVSWDGEHQYDEAGRPVATWYKKFCNWIIEPEFENERIVYEKDKDGSPMFTEAMTMAEFRKMYPDIESRPDIYVTWYWHPDGFKEQFGEPSPSENGSMTERYWGYLKYTEQQAIDKLGRYSGLNVHAYRTVVEYNKRIIFDGRLD